MLFRLSLLHTTYPLLRINILALDIGKRRTGVAFTTAELGVPLALDTIKHASDEELLTALEEIVKEKRVDVVVIGLPRLLSGEEGEQAQYVREVAQKIASFSVKLEFVDERYTTPKQQDIDSDAASACHILTMYLDKNNI